MNIWKEYKLIEIMNIIGGGTPKTSVPAYWNGKIPWLSVKDFNTDFRTIYQTEKYITKLGLNESSTKLLETGDLIISARGTVGALAQLGKPMAFNQSCYGLKANDLTTNDYLYYLLKYMLKNIQLNTHGSVFDTITKETFNILTARIPTNIEEQKSTAHILSTLDEKIEVNNQINKTLEDMAQAIFKQWFVDFEFPDKNGEPYKSSGGKMVDSELGMIPEGWEVIEVDTLCNQVKPGTNYQPKRTEDGIPFLNVRNINKGCIDVSDVKYITKEDYQRVHKVWKPEENDILISRIGTLGLVAVIRKRDLPIAVHYNFIDIKADNETFQFLYFALKSDFFQLQYHGIKKASVQEYVTIDEVKKLKFMIPSDHDLFMLLKNTFTNLYNLINLKQEETEYMIRIHNTLLPKLMSGEIRVNN